MIQVRVGCQLGRLCLGANVQKRCTQVAVCENRFAWRRIGMRVRSPQDWNRRLTAAAARQANGQPASPEDERQRRPGNHRQRAAADQNEY